MTAALARQFSCCAFSPDGQSLLGGSDAGSLALWPCAGPPPAGGAAASQEAGRGGQLWPACGGAGARAQRAMSAGVTVVKFAPGGRGPVRALSADCGGVLALWDAATGRRVGTLRGHSKAVTDFAFSPDGVRCLSASRDVTLRLWHLGAPEAPRSAGAAPACMLVLAGHTGSVGVCALSLDGQSALSGGADSTLRLWPLTFSRERFAMFDSRFKARAAALFLEWRIAGMDEGILFRIISLAARGETLSMPARPARGMQLSCFSSSSDDDAGELADGELVEAEEGLENEHDHQWAAARGRAAGWTRGGLVESPAFGGSLLVRVFMLYDVYVPSCRAVLGSTRWWWWWCSRTRRSVVCDNLQLV